ncbi:MAG: cytochrome c biogenesis protein CcsA, partial [Verrucomicrobia bacterium]|nr:cytochrome c biogenesis protein CcsA [Verrucomicrobiota bacterium]
MAVALLTIAYCLVPAASKSGFDAEGFGRLPVLLNGRTQPLDSVARNSLLILRGKQTLALEKGGSMPAIRWLMEVFFDGSKADSRTIFRIDHPELRGMLGVSDEEKYFSMAQFQPKLQSLLKETQRIESEQIKPEAQSPFEKAVMRLNNNVILYRRLKNSMQHEETRDFEADLAAYQTAIAPGVKAIQAREGGQEFDQKAFDRILDHLQRYDMMARFGYTLAVPSGSPNHVRDDWTTVGAALMEAARGGSIGTPISLFARMADAYRSDKVEVFNAALTEYGGWLAEHRYVPELAKGRSEHYFNRIEAFYVTAVFYVFVFILACASWFNNVPALSRAAWQLLILTWIAHTAGLIYRMILEGRPPVTNLYSSAVFIGWGIAGLGILLERIHSNAIGSVLAAIGGGSTLVVAHHLAMDGDTMEMMRAVLDTNFWLSTHVVAVTLGYAATFAAGFLALLYVLRGFFTTSLSTDMAKSLSRMVYGVICFATLLSFTGTVLGGIWADQSWGRFWGWDP